MTPQHEDITLLELDHPGAQDPVYRARRDTIATAAQRFREHPESPIPLIDYTQEEQATWKTIVEKLAVLHKQHASGLYLSAREALAIRADEIPELRNLNNKLRRDHAFGLAPIEGLIETKAFLSELGRRTMYCTQYIRHASKPEYTPEPDIVHEVIGHVPMFTNRDLVEFTVLLGKVAENAPPDHIELLARLYWYTIEFGLIEEAGEVKAFGAGLLSSFGEIQHCFTREVERKPFSVQTILETPYDYSHMQNVLFVIPSFETLRKSSIEFLRTLGYPA